MAEPSNYQLINKIISSGKLITEGKPYEEAYDIFPNCIKAEYQFIHEFYKKYGKIPSAETFKEKFEIWELGDCAESDDYLLDTLEEDMIYDKALALNGVGSIIAQNPRDGVNKAFDILSNIKDFEGYYLTNSEQIPTFADLLKQSLINNAEARIKTGFDEMDSDVGGLRKGNEVAIIVARTGVGKSWVLQKMALSAYLDDDLEGNVAIISPEMDAADMASRMYLLYKHTNYTEQDDISTFCSKPKDIIIVTPSQISSVFTHESIKSFIKTNKIGALYIDGISYIKTGNSRTDETDVMRLGEVTRELMLLSDQFKIPIVGVIQANRDAARDLTTPPELSTIRGCDEIAHIATIVYSLAYDNGDLKIRIAKNRRGKTGDTYIYKWDIAKGIYTFDSKKHFEDLTVDERRQQDIDRQVRFSMDATKLMRKGTIRPGKGEFI